MFMQPDLFLAYFLSVVTLACTPGVASAALARKTLHQGSNAGVHMAMGILVARLSKTLLIVVGLAQLSDIVEFAGDWLRYCGAAYLSFVGYRVLFGLDRKCASTAANGQPWQQFSNGFLISWSNPNALFFVAIVLPQFIDRSGQVWQQLTVLGIVWAFVALIVELVLVLCVARLGQSTSSILGNRGSRFVLGSILMGIAIWLLLGP